MSATDLSDLLAHANALRRLARGILGDAHAAEDVVQETWVRALRRPSDRERTRGWLAAVTRSLALRRVRGDGRRRAREEREPAARGHGAAADVAARRQALARLTAAVLALEEPYQTAILLRFYDDLPPREVAARLDVPVATVKSWIARGLERLRARVDRDLAEDGTTPERAFAFLVGPALPVAPPAAGPDGNRVPGAPAGSAGIGTAAGAIAMGMQTKVAAGVAAAALVGWVAWQGLGRAVATPAAPTATAAAHAPGMRVGDVELAAGAQAALAPSPAPAERAPAAAAAADGFADATHEPSPDPYAFTLAGVVVDADDLPAANARVYAGPLGAPRNATVATDADGRFALSWRGPAPALEVAFDAHAHGASSGLHRHRLAAGTTEVLLRVERAEVRVLELAATPGNAAEGPDGAGETTPALLVTHEVRGLRPPAWAPDFAPDEGGCGRFALQVDRCPSGAGETQWLRFDSPDGISWSAILEHSEGNPTFLSAGAATTAPPRFRLTGVVRDARGAPVPGALVALGSSPGRGDGPRTRAGDNGTFELADVEPGTWYARAGGRDHGRAELVVDAHDGGARVWDAWLDRGLELRGRLVDAATGAPLAGWAVEVAGDAADSAWTDAAGRFAIPNLPRRALAVLGRPGEAPRGLAHELARAVVPGGDELVFEVDAARGPREPAKAGALLRIEGKNGKPIAGGEVRLWSLATGRGVTLARAADAYALAAPLPAGAYEVEALVPGRAPLHLGPLHLPGGAGGDGADLGVLRVVPRGTLRLHEEADEEVLARWTAALWELRGDTRVLVTAVAGALPKRLDLPAGRYELDLAPNAEHAAVALLLERGAAPPARRLAFDVAPGRTTRVELRRDARGAAAAVSPDAPPPADDLPARVAAAARLLADAEGTVAVEDVVVLVDPDSAADAFRSTEPLRPVVLEMLTDMFDRSSCTRCH